jgi:peptidoglycan/LPS O-acetylase OafA/YrhL
MSLCYTKYFTSRGFLAYYGLMREQQKRDINQLSIWVAGFLSIIALIAVLSGYAEPPQLDEGPAAHIFQLSIVVLVPTIALFLATADWSRSLLTLRPLALSIVALVLAFGALYYLEHYRNPTYVGRMVKPAIPTACLPTSYS